MSVKVIIKPAIHAFLCHLIIYHYYFRGGYSFYDRLFSRSAIRLNGMCFRAGSLRHVFSATGRNDQQQKEGINSCLLKWHWVFGRIFQLLYQCWAEIILFTNSRSFLISREAKIVIERYRTSAFNNEENKQQQYDDREEQIRACCTQSCIH